MAELKTKETSASVAAFLKKVDKARREDCQTIVDIMRDVTKEEPKMWGSSIVGFGRYHYKYASGREGDWPIVGFSPRKDALTVYLMGGFQAFSELLEKFGKYKASKGSCLYIKKLADVDLAILRKLVAKSCKQMATHRIK
ncbi:MAG TPA: DUF1801 domain-containing protein [Pyrinomonadaceae bacterium]|nr:DUF1801 domain-containing protein [Pyrinomonadaceae bacterium]